MATKNKIENREKNNQLEEKTSKVTRIELVCDVYYNDRKYKKGEVLELEKSELEKFAESFYKKI